MGEVEHHPRPLFQHVEIETGIRQQGDPLLHRLPLSRRLIELGLRDLQLLIQLQPGNDAPVAVNGFIDELAREAGPQHRERHLSGTALQIAAKIHPATESQSDSGCNRKAIQSLGKMH